MSSTLHWLLQTNELESCWPKAPACGYLESRSQQDASLSLDKVLSWALPSALPPPPVDHMTILVASVESWPAIQDPEPLDLEVTPALGIL